MHQLQKHGIRASAPEGPNKKQKMNEEDTDMDMDIIEDVQMADGDSNFTIKDAQIGGEGSNITIKDAQMGGEDLLRTTEDQQKSNKSIPTGPFLSLPGELRQIIYEKHLSDCQTVLGLIYKHPDITHASLGPTGAISKLSSNKTGRVPIPANQTESQIESQLTKMIGAVIKPHPFILLKNRQITSEYSGAARKYIIHALTINVVSLPLLHTWSNIPLQELTRLKLTIDFGNLTNNVDPSRVRDHIVSFVEKMPNLVDLQILYRHASVVNQITGNLMNDWQTIRYELVYDLLPLLKKMKGKKEKTIRIFPFVMERGGWNRVQFP